MAVFFYNAYTRLPLVKSLTTLVVLLVYNYYAIVMALFLMNPE